MIKQKRNLNREDEKYHFMHAMKTQKKDEDEEGK